MRRILAVLLLFVSTASDAAQRAFITEFATARVEAQAPIANLPAQVHQPPLTLSAVAVTSATFSASTRYIRIVCEVQCSIRLGTGASLTDMMLPAGRPEYFGIQPSTYRTISVIYNP